MVFVYILAAAYLAVTVFSVVMTCLESAEKDCEPKTYHAVGVVLCLVWPVLILATLATQTYLRFTSRRMRHSNG